MGEAGGMGICFVIAPIGEAESDVRRRSDQVLKHVVRPAARNCGFNAIRADEISEPGIITTQVIQHIVDDPMIVADLTGTNPNVFYELAIRHALRKPYVQIIQKGERIPFDVAGVRTIEVDHRDLDSVEAARLEIERQMQAASGSETGIESPISVAVDLDRLRKSDNPEERQLADLFASVSDIKLAISSVQKTLSEQPRYARELLWDIDRARISSRFRDEARYLTRELRNVLEEGSVAEESRGRILHLAEMVTEVLERLSHSDDTRWLRDLDPAKESAGIQK